MWGTETRSGTKGAQTHSCSSPVLVEQATEQVSSMYDALAVVGDDGQCGGGVRRLKLERPVGTMAVVVPDVDPKDLLKVTAADDQQPVQALGTNGPNPPFGEGIRVGRLYRRHQHVHTFRAEHVIEPTAELRVPIAHKKAHAAPPLLQREQQVAGLLGRPGGVGLAVTPAKWTRRLSSSRKNSTYSRRNQIVSTVRRVAGGSHTPRPLSNRACSVG